MKFGVVVFPGSNCDHDCYYVVKKVLRQPVEFIWHQTSKLSEVDCIILPGGFLMVIIFGVELLPNFPL